MRSPRACAGPRSRFGSRLEPFTHVDLQLAEGRNLDVVTQAETLDAVRGPARRRLRPLHRRHGDARDRRAAGRRGEGAVGAAVPAARRRRCARCCDGGRSPGQVLDSFLLRSLAVAGYAPVVRRTARAAALEGPHRWFNPSAGGMLCATCRVPGSASPAPETVEVLGALLAGDWPVVEAADPRHLREATGLVVGVPAVAPRARAEVDRVRAAVAVSPRRAAGRGRR